MSISDSQLKRIKEVVAEVARKADRVTAWESEFLESVNRGAVTFGTRVEFSEKQWDIFLRIERKVFRS